MALTATHSTNYMLTAIEITHSDNYVFIAYWQCKTRIPTRPNDASDSPPNTSLARCNLARSLIFCIRVVDTTGTYCNTYLLGLFKIYSIVLEICLKKSLLLQTTLNKMHCGSKIDLLIEKESCPILAG